MEYKYIFLYENKCAYTNSLLKTRPQKYHYKKEQKTQWRSSYGSNLTILLIYTIIIYVYIHFVSIKYT